MARKKENPETEGLLETARAEETEEMNKEVMEGEADNAEEGMDAYTGAEAGEENENENESYSYGEDDMEEYSAEGDTEAVEFKDDEELIIPQSTEESMLDDYEEEEYEQDENEKAATETDETGSDSTTANTNAARSRFRSRIMPEGLGGNDRVEKAGKRTKRKLYHSDVVHTEEGIKHVKRQDTKRHQEYMELVASAKNRTILKGTLLSRREQGNYILGEVAYGDYFTVCIPFEFLVDMSIQPPVKNVNVDDESLTPEEKKNAETFVQKNIINRRIGSEIDFIALEVKEREGIAYGSHVDAMVKKARKYYTAQNMYQMPECLPGAIIEAQIMQVNSIGIFVEALGVETFIMQNELDWLRISDVSEKYNVGDKINIKLLEVTPHTIVANNRKINTVAIKASVKQTTQNPNEAFYNKIQIGQVGQGIVTQITESGIFVIFNNKVSVKCNLFEGAAKQPGPGSQVLVYIDRKFDENHLFSGIIKTVIKYANE